MIVPSNTSSESDVPNWKIILIGCLALAVTMGVGRFAFTPLMPLMLRDGTFQAQTGAEWAAANYVGYLIGALTASHFSTHPKQGLLLSLLGITLTTAAIYLIEPSTFSLYSGALLRLISGVFSAWTIVCASTWCLGELSRNRAPQLGAWIYTGVGIGIVFAGLLAWLGGQQTAKILWLELGFLAAVGTLIVWFGLAQTQAQRSKPANTANPVTKPTETKNQFGLVMCYGTFGFGYIVQATFLPTMARQQISDPLVFGLTWPIFGLAATLSVCTCAYWLKNWPRRRVWAFAQFFMALGTLIPLLSKEIEALALSAIFVGGTFMVTTMAGLQLAREQAPANPMPLLAKMTMAFALGQIAGPLFVRLLGPDGLAGWDAFTCTNALATILLMATSVWLWNPWQSAKPAI